jgi:DNA-binding response OmpR family regulator
MQALWESDSFIDDNTLTVNVARLRAHLAEIGLEGLIRTQKGLGYLVDET